MSWMDTFCVRDLGELNFAGQRWVVVLDAIESKTPPYLPTNTKGEASGRLELAEMPLGTIEDSSQRTHICKRGSLDITANWQC